jgi:hypothetical protein
LRQWQERESCGPRIRILPWRSTNIDHGATLIVQ